MTKQETQAMIDEMKKDKERKGGRNVWTPDSKFEGTIKLRFLPPLKQKNERKFYFNHRVHWIDGIPYEDLSQTFYDKDGNVIHEPERDPVQEFVKKLYKTSQKGSDDWKLASSLNSRERFISRVIIRDQENVENELTPVFYEYGPTIYNILFHIITETEFGNIVDPKAGRDFNLTKVGTGRQSKYETSTPSANVTPIFSDAEQLKTMFENAMKMDFQSLIEIPTLEAKQEALNEHLGIATKTQITKPTPKIEDEDLEIDENLEVDEEESDDEIDSILNEFAG